VATVALTLAACEDSPTGPTSYAHVADGRTWVAVAEPAGLAAVESWLPYVGTGPAAERIGALRADAASARSAGRVEVARALEAEAFAVAGAALERTPGSEALRPALAALDAWTMRAAGRLDVDPDGGLAAAAAEVGDLHRAAHASLARGDTAAAVAEITRASAVAREWSPVSVGLRLLARAEERLDAGGASEPVAARARRLLAGAREGLVTGDSVRAVRRALYALQLLEADGEP
jgi:hypothetical protein